MTDRLMEIFNFTASDLSYNRSGQLSPPQQVRVARSRRQVKMGLWVIGMILLAIAGVWMVIFSRQAERSAALVAMAVGAIIFGLPGLGALYLGVRPAPKTDLEKLQGRVRVGRIEHVGKSRGKYVNTEMHLGDRIFVVPDPAFSELEDGTEYAIYAWKGTGDIFSLEKL